MGKKRPFIRRRKPSTVRRGRVEDGILEIDSDCRVFDVAFAFDALDYPRERGSFALDNSFDDLAHDARFIAPLL